MRAGPLSDKEVIEKLNSEFINSWIIIPEFEEPQKFFEDEKVVSWARAIAADFTYPVDSIVLSADGKTLAQGEFQKMFSGGSKAYKTMLEAALR